MDIPVRRRRHKKKTDPKLYALIGLCTVLLVALIIVAVVLTKTRNQVDVKETQPTVETQIPVLEILGQQEGEDVILVKTSYANVKYPFAFSELIHVRATDTESVKTLEFYTVLGGQEYRLFDVIFGGTEGIRLGDITVPGRSTTMPVFAVIHDEGRELDEENKRSYVAARDCFNDVVVSLSDNKGFTPMR